MQPLLRFLAACFVLALLLSPIASGFAQAEDENDDPGANFSENKYIDARWNQMDVGPFLASVLGTPAGQVAKGLSIKLGDDQKTAVCYDTKNMALRAVWNDGFLKFSDKRYGIMHAPQIAGNVVFSNSQPSFNGEKVQYRGMYLHGKQAVLSYDVDGVSILESPGVRIIDGAKVLTRTLEIAPHDKPLSLRLANKPAQPAKAATVPKFDAGTAAAYSSDGRALVAATFAASETPGELQLAGDVPALLLPPSKVPQRCELFTWLSPAEAVAAFAKLPSPAEIANVQTLSQPGESLWKERFSTKFRQGEGDGPYVVDTVEVPFDNPYKALMFTSGFDFFANGDVAVSTMHGDVWRVSINDETKTATWNRFATGLCQPLGLKIVANEVYVLGKDQITRLHDRNNDGEADFYECFNNGGATSLGGHDYAACLETDPEGNFYYIRAIEGVCRVSKDGSKHESLATGFRNPVGMGVSPTGLVTATPQEGNWTPASAIVAIKPGGYYGYAGPQVTDDRPLGYDAPLCWMPRTQDNSSGGQVWVANENWGLPKGQMIHFSYGRCSPLLVLAENVGGVWQGGTLQLPLQFESGAMRGRFNPRDGQLWVCGLMGWQTSAAKDGCLQRVRYTGKPVHVPTALKVLPNGLALTFNHPLDKTTATDPDNYAIEQWNYLYSKEYGSKDYRPSDPKKFGRDEVYIDDVELSDDGRTVTLRFEDDVTPVMQMKITYQLEAADGTPLKQSIYNTINVVPK